jgi:hypothetical protein
MSTVPGDSAGDAAPVWGPVVISAVFAAANLLTYLGNENSRLRKILFPQCCHCPRVLYISNRYAKQGFQYAKQDFSYAKQGY